VKSGLSIADRKQLTVTIWWPQEVFETLEMLQQQALALGRENLQYKARLSKQHKVMVMQMHMISHLETVLQKKVCTLPPL
jgi:hypothetical protein